MADDYTAFYRGRRALQGQPLRYSVIGKVDGLWAQAGRLTLDDGRVLSVAALRDPGTGLLTSARAELSRPGGKPQPVSAAELAGLLKGE